MEVKTKQGLFLGGGADENLKKDTVTGNCSAVKENLMIGTEGVLVSRCFHFMLFDICLLIDLTCKHGHFQTMSQVTFNWKLIH